MGTFCPPTYMLKHVSLLPKKNGSKPLCMDILFNKRSLKSPRMFSLPTLLPLKEVSSQEDKRVNEEEEDLNQFHLPPIFDDYGDVELLDFTDYGDYELLDFEDLGEISVLLSFCEEEELTYKEELHISPYKTTCFHQEDKLEETTDFYSSTFLVSSHISHLF